LGKFVHSDIDEDNDNSVAAMSVSKVHCGDGVTFSRCDFPERKLSILMVLANRNVRRRGSASNMTNARELRRQPSTTDRRTGRGNRFIV
jgi:hypothetical protein